MSPLSLRKSEDCFVDDLFAPVAAAGVPLIAARFPRAFLDVNREPYELDPELFLEPLPDFANTQSVRVAGGLGTIARIVADGEEIYRHKLPLASGIARVEQLYIPFHAALCDLIETTRSRFGYAILIDCHSMPSASMAPAGGPRPDIVLGDRFGASADCKITRFLKDALGGLGYEVHMNRPYAGGYITEHYGRPARDVHAVQIEINRGLYLDELTLRPTAGFEELQRGPAKPGGFPVQRLAGAARASRRGRMSHARGAMLPRARMAKLCRALMLQRKKFAPAGSEATAKISLRA